MIDVAFDRVSKRYRIRRPVRPFPGGAAARGELEAPTRSTGSTGARPSTSCTASWLRGYFYTPHEWRLVTEHAQVGIIVPTHNRAAFFSGFVRERCVCLARR
jgi:hypothetical protein